LTRYPHRQAACASGDVVTRESSLVPIVTPPVCRECQGMRRDHRTSRQDLTNPWIQLLCHHYRSGLSYWPLLLKLSGTFLKMCGFCQRGTATADPVRDPGDHLLGVDA